MTKMILSALFASVLIMPMAQAESCKPEFSSHVRHMAKVASRISAKCWREAEKGERNRDRIKEMCNGNDMNMVLELRNHKRDLLSLCRRDRCQPELNKLKVCNESATIQQLINRLGLR